VKGQLAEIIAVIGQDVKGVELDFMVLLAEVQFRLKPSLICVRDSMAETSGSGR
jgi:hypothetical protein